MFKVFLVDDEAVICNGLIHLIDWVSLDCEVCGSETNGKRGLTSILESKPDIVISDICMPEMDGIEMVRLVKSQLPYCKIIMVTAYREFDYIHDAVKIGTFDFVLKPFKIDTIAASIRRAVTELKFQLTREAEFSKLRDYYEKSMPILKEKCLFDLLMNSSTASKEQKRLAEYGVVLNNFILASCRIPEQPDSSADDNMSRLGVVKTFFDTLAQKYQIEKVSVNSKLCAFVFCFDNRRESLIAERFYKDISDVVNLIFQCFQITIAVGISSWGSGAAALAAKYEESVYALEQVEDDEQTIVLFDDLEHLYKETEISFFESVQKRLISTVQLGKPDEVDQLLQTVQEHIQDSRSVNVTLLANFFATTYEKLRYLEDSLSHLIDSDDPHCHAQALADCSDWQTAFDSICLYAGRVVRQIQGFNTCQTNDIVLNAVKYIEENYQNPITLNCVAEHVHVSLFYLSRLFKKQYNQTFSDYLINTRIHFAKQYLRDTQYKAYEIGELVGITDPHYFCKCFKKCVGQTPTVYREQYAKV
ncbi:MAG: response regulator [Angelakisella sp.]